MEIVHAWSMVMIVTGIVTGTISRLITIKIDYRQIPSYPNGYFLHLVGGFIAAALGAVAIPALIEKDFAAVTFLALALEHFRDIRRIETESLEKLEDTGQALRGAAYIDGIAKTFESRNYIAMLTALLTVLAMVIFHSENILSDVLAGVVAGAITVTALFFFTKGKVIGDICTLTPGEIRVEGSELFVDGLFVTNMLGADKSRALFREEGIAVVIEPKDAAVRISLENYGQRQAILFEAIRTFGVKRYYFVKRSFSTGKIIVAFVPVIRDMDRLLAVLRQTPILESSRKIRRIIKSPLLGGK